MYTLVSRAMPRPKPAGPIKTFQLKLSTEQSARWLKLFTAAKERNPYVNDTIFNRLLLGLEDDPEILTEKDRLFFRGAKLPSEMKGPVESKKPRLKEVSPKNRRK